MEWLPIPQWESMLKFEWYSFQQADLYLSKYVNAVPDDVRARKLLGAVRL